MTTYINQQWLLDKRPSGMPDDECWKWNEVEVPELPTKPMISPLFTF